MSPIVESAASSAGGGGMKELAYVEFTAAFTGPGTVVSTGNIALVGGEVILVNFYCPYIQLDSSLGTSQTQLQINSGTPSTLAYQFATGLTDTRFTQFASRRISGLAAGIYNFHILAANANGTYQAQDGIGADLSPGYVQVIQIV